MKPLIDAIETVAKYQPETFRGVTELQGGWFSSVGGTLSEAQGHNAAQITQLTLAAIERGCTSINYYMFYGGSNFGLGAARGLTQTYDYNAPSSRMGRRAGPLLCRHSDRRDAQGARPATDSFSAGRVDDRRRSSGRQHLPAAVRRWLAILLRAQCKAERTTIGHREGAGEGWAGTNAQLRIGQLWGKGAVCPGRREWFSAGEWLPKPVEPPTVLQPAPVAAVPVRIASIAAEEPADDWRPVVKESISTRPASLISGTFTTA